MRPRRGGRRQHHVTGRFTRERASLLEMTRAEIQEALRYCTRPEHLRRTVRLALIVGALRTLIIQSAVIAAGDATGAVRAQ